MRNAGPLFAKRRRAQTERPPAIPELKLHMAVAADLRKWARPEWLWTHFPAGEKRDGTIGAKLKQMGLQPGWADFIFVSPAGLFHALELKRLGAKLNDNQKVFRDQCLTIGCPWEMAATIEQAWDVLERWNVMRIRRADPIRPDQAIEAQRT